MYPPTIEVKPLPEGYSFVETPPPLDDYLNLRAKTGLTPKSKEQGEKAINGAWYSVHLTCASNDGPQAIAMARVIGDGGWYFHIIDMAVLPEHQRKGLGDYLMGRLLQKIYAEAPEKPYINLIADPPGRKLYARHGFRVLDGVNGKGSMGMDRYEY